MKNEFGSKFEMVCDILDRHERNSSNLIAILQEIQEAYSYLPEDVMTYVATALEVSPNTVFGVATFYSHFTLDPKGKYVIRVCDGTACHVKKSEEIINTLEKELGLSKTKKTSNDMLFTLGNSRLSWSLRHRACSCNQRGSAWVDESCKSKRTY